MNTQLILNGIRSSVNSVRHNGYALFYASIVFFSFSCILIKHAGNEYGTSFWLVSAVRFTIGTAIVSCLFRRNRASDLKALVSNPWLISRGVLGGCGVLLFNLCIIKIGAGRTNIICATFPIFATLIAPVFLDESIRVKNVVYCTLALTGIVMMSTEGLQGKHVGIYEFIALLVAIISAVVVVLIRKLHQNHNTATIFNAQCLYGLAFALPGLLTAQRSVQFAELVLITVAGICIALGQLTMTHGYRIINVSQGATIQLLSPVLVLLSSVVFLNESFNTTDLVGITIILYACWKGIKKERPTQSNQS